MTTTKPTYRPTSVAAAPAATYSLFPVTYSLNFAFSAKERDTETGLSYFGARYYSSDLSVWLSVDPMSDKYPSLSPYVYCADNPVRCVDPNGEDFETEIDFENKTITIRATYYTANANRKILQEGVDIWNQQSGKYSYFMREGENEVEFSIVFDLRIAEGDYNTDSEIPVLSQSMNAFFIQDHVYDNKGIEDRGNSDGSCIYVSSNQSLPGFNMVRSTAHEIGHTLGCGEHWGMNSYTDLMTSGGTMSTISIRDVRAIMFMAGYSNPEEANLDFQSPGKSCDRPQLDEFWGRVVQK